jgi:Predicted membrane protein
MEETNQKFCIRCGEKIDANAQFCPKCGAAQTMVRSNTVNKEWIITLILCVLVGEFGIHRFYHGKIGTGILQLITLGGLGVWYLIDLVMVVCERFKDKNGAYITIYQGREAF